MQDNKPINLHHRDRLSPLKLKWMSKSFLKTRMPVRVRLRALRVMPSEAAGLITLASRTGRKSPARYRWMLWEVAWFHKPSEAGSNPTPATMRRSSPGGETSPTKRSCRVRSPGAVPNAVVVKRETRQLEVLVGESPCEFDSRRRHQLIRMLRWWNGRRATFRP